MASKDDEKELEQLRDRLVALAPKARTRAFLKDGPEAFIKLQQDIGQLQADIQKAVGIAKAKRDTSKRGHQHLEHLKEVRWHSRRLGDAVAWLVLLLNRKVIRSLGSSSKVPIAPEENDGSRGVWKWAQNVLYSRWGLPIVHDITSCLTVGDLTMLVINEQMRRDHQFRTFEVKTTRIAATPDPDGDSQTLQLQSTMIGIEPMPEYIESTVAEAPPPVERVTHRGDRRIDRQMKRLGRAIDLKNSPEGGISSVDGQAHINLSTRHISDKSHWGELNTAIRKAKEQGYSFFTLDKFIGWCIAYNPDGVQVSDLTNTSFTEDAARLMMPDYKNLNSITFSAVPADEDNRSGAAAMPFYLWNVPQDVIEDIIRGRLVIYSLTNIGRLQVALEEAGLEVHRNPDSRDQRSLLIETRLKWDDGTEATVQGRTPWLDIEQAIQEFQSMATVVGKTLAIQDIPKTVAADDFFEFPNEGAWF